jgi:hypothetical protein
MEKRIQIPLKLYELMVNYIQDHYDPTDRQRFWAIHNGIEQKRKAEIRHNLYSAYKTTSDPETREILRTSYLDEAGIPSHGRWGEETDQNFSKGNFEC